MVKKIFIILVFLHLSIVNVFTEEDFRLVVLDVGEGQAVLLQSGDAGVLIDTGHFGRGHDVVKSIREYGVVHLDFVFLTHLHADHASGIFRVMESFPMATIYESGHRTSFNPHRDAVRWVADALDSNIWEVKKVKQGDRFDWRGVSIDVLWPEKVSGQSLNPQSLVVAAEYDNSHFLVMGDVGTNEEAQLIVEKRLPKKVAVLVVGHHGAIDATTDALLQEIQPEYSVISTDKENKRNYPDSKIVERLIRIGTSLHLTAEQGDFIWSKRGTTTKLQ